MTWRLHALALIAVAAALLLPARAAAALLPVCEKDELASITPPPPEPVCEVVTTVDDLTGATQFAPICDPRGASAIAPPRILPVADARIEAAPSPCEFDDFAFGFAPGREQPPPSGAAAPPPDPAHLTAIALRIARGHTVILDFVEDPGAPRSGVRRQVDRPPR